MELMAGDKRIRKQQDWIMWSVYPYLKYNKTATIGASNCLDMLCFQNLCQNCVTDGINKIMGSQGNRFCPKINIYVPCPYLIVLHQISPS